MPARRLHLRLLQTTDLHGHLRPYDYFLDTPAPGTGLSALAGLIETARNSTENCLLFDCGDLIQGTPFADLLTGHDGPHPMVRALDALRYDAATLGNHDFDFGFDAALNAFHGAETPILAANLRTPDATSIYPESILLERDLTDEMGDTVVFKIGLFGVLPPQTAMWNGHHLSGHAVVTDALEAAGREAAALREAGADLVIALAHSGLGDKDPIPMAENVSKAILAFDAVDVVLAAHTHQLVPAKDDAALEPILQAGAMASHLGQMDLTLEQDGQAWRIVEVDRQLIAPPPDAPASPLLLALSEADHVASLAHIRRTIGESSVPLNSYFNVLGYDAGATLAADAALDCARSYAPDAACLAAIAPFRAGGAMGPEFYTDVPKGALLFRHAAEIYLYPNEVRLIRATGNVIRDWLDHAAGLYHQIDEKSGRQDLIVRDRPPYNADTMFGLTYEIDLSKPARFDAEGHQISDQSRIKDLCHEGKPVSDDQTFVVATNSYRASGGGGFHWLANCPVVEIPPVVMRDVLASYIERTGQVAPNPRLPFSFTSLGGRQILFETGPGAKAHIGTVSDLGLVIAGTSDEGFLQLGFSL